MNKFTVDSHELNKVLDYLTELNKQDLANIRWIKDGRELDINPELIKEWKFTGLSNKDFALAYLHYE